MARLFRMYAIGSLIVSVLGVGGFYITQGGFNMPGGATASEAQEMGSTISGGIDDVLNASPIEHPPLVAPEFGACYRTHSQVSRSCDELHMQEAFFVRPFDGANPATIEECTERFGEMYPAVDLEDPEIGFTIGTRLDDSAEPTDVCTAVFPNGASRFVLADFDRVEPTGLEAPIAVEQLDLSGLDLSQIELPTEAPAEAPAEPQSEDEPVTVSGGLDFGALKTTLDN